MKLELSEPLSVATLWNVNTHALQLARATWLPTTRAAHEHVDVLSMRGASRYRSLVCRLQEVWSSSQDVGLRLMRPL